MIYRISESGFEGEEAVAKGERDGCWQIIEIPHVDIMKQMSG